MSNWRRRMWRCGGVLLAVLLLAARPATQAGAAPGGPTGPSTAPAAPDGTPCMPAVDAVFGQVPWAQRRLDPQRVWMLTRGGSVTVAVVDTGVSRSAPALAGRVLPGQDVLTGGPADSDCTGHGTFVAGLVAASPRGTEGSAGPGDGGGFAGVAPDARILPIRVSYSAEDVDPDLLARGIQAAVQGGATVIAVVATAPFGSPALQRAVELADRSGALVVAAAVTMRNQQGDVAYPAALPGVVSVMGVGSDGHPAGTQPPTRVTLAAPGQDLVSIAANGRGNVEGSGAGLAVGYVAGAAALVRAYLPGLSTAAVRERLAATADPAGSDPLLGRGVVDPVAAVTAVLPGRTERGPAPPKPDPVVLPRVPAVDRRPARAAAAWAAGAILGGIAVCLVGQIMLSGRRRAWSADP